MNILSLPKAYRVNTRFAENCRVILSTYNVNESEDFPYVSGIYVNEELKEIGIEQCTSQKGVIYKTNKFKYDGNYCCVSVNDDGILTIAVDKFARNGTPESEVLTGKWSSIEAGRPRELDRVMEELDELKEYILQLEAKYKLLQEEFQLRVDYTNECRALQYKVNCLETELKKHEAK